MSFNHIKTKHSWGQFFSFFQRHKLRCFTTCFITFICRGYHSCCSSLNWFNSVLVMWICAGPDLATIFYIGPYEWGISGSRNSEVWRLTKPNIDFAFETLNVQSSMKFNFELNITPRSLNLYTLSILLPSILYSKFI